MGDKAEWAPRISKGMDVLYASVFNGLAPGMPARGLCFTCSDDDLKAVVDFMVEKAN
jgi:cytochrome c5